MGPVPEVNTSGRGTQLTLTQRLENIYIADDLHGRIVTLHVKYTERVRQVNVIKTKPMRTNTTMPSYPLCQSTIKQ